MTKIFLSKVNVTLTLQKKKQVKNDNIIHADESQEREFE